jgi:hypothetical protein
MTIREPGAQQAPGQANCDRLGIVTTLPSEFLRWLIHSLSTVATRQRRGKRPKLRHLPYILYKILLN